MNRDSFDSLPLFKGLDTKHLNLLAKRFDSETFGEGDVIFERDARAERLYFLISGRVAIRFKPPDGDVIPVTEIEEGGVFGWSAALGRKSYTSCAVSIKPSLIFSVKGEDLTLLCEKHPDAGVVILERLADVIAQRLQNTHTHVVRILREGVATKVL
ncbi:MAG: Crp/Fnr family transcriptional regulator [Anaerolineales bacterium]